MPQAPPLHVPGETLTAALLRGCREHPDRPFIDDRSSGTLISWGEASATLVSVMQQWEESGLGTQVILRGDGSWRTIIAYLAAHLSGRLLVCGDVSNPVTFGGAPLDQATLDVIELGEIAQRSGPPASTDSSLSEERCHSWQESDVGRIFRTSGSTGEPKLLGVLAENRFGSDSPLFVRGTSCSHYKVLSIRRPSTVAFNANVRRTVKSGGTMYLVDLSRHDLRELDALLGDSEVAEVNLTPTMLLQLAAVSTHAWTHSVESVNLSGERVMHESLEQARRLFPRALLRNNYGMTEGAASFAALVLEPEAPLPEDPVPVGVVNPQLSVQVLSDHDAEMPPGQSGRVVVKGLPPVTEAYVDDTGHLCLRELHSADRLETGDLGRFTMDGLLVIEGRSEQMVKIRGERTSLLDVESAVMETGMVAEVLAAVYTDSKGTPAIGAVVVPCGEALSLAEMRRRISEHHRLVLCPTRVVTVDEIPVLPTGKVDRVSASALLAAAHEPERTEVYSAAEMTLCRIIADVLALPLVDREDDVFALGADSLSSLQILHDMEEHFGRRFDVGFLLAHPTIIEMGAALASDIENPSRILPLGGQRSGTTLYWVLPGANPYMARPIAMRMPDTRHVALLNLGALPGDVVLCDVDRMVGALAMAVREDAVRNGEPFLLAGFSSACYLANALAMKLAESGDTASGLVLIDPPAHQSLVDEWRLSGKTANPIRIMEGREGVLALHDPVTADRGVFGLQLFALSRHTPARATVPRMFVGASMDRFREPQWSPDESDGVHIVEQAHLDFIRKPEAVAEALEKWPVWAELTGLATDQV